MTHLLGRPRPSPSPETLCVPPALVPEHLPGGLAGPAMGPAPRRGCLHPEEGAPGSPGAREADLQVPSETGREVHPSGWLRGPGPAAPAWVSVPGGPPATVVTVSSELPSGQPGPPGLSPELSAGRGLGTGGQEAAASPASPSGPWPSTRPRGQSWSWSRSSARLTRLPTVPEGPRIPGCSLVSLRRRTRLRRGSSGGGRGGCWPPSGCGLSPGNRRHRNTSRRCHLLLAELKSSPHSTRAPGAAWGSWRVGPGG